MLKMKSLLVLVLMFVCSLVFVGCGECEHNYVNGKCEKCDEAHDCKYVDGVCSCGAKEEDKGKEEKVVKVGVLQLMSHDALGLATEGFKEGLIKAGYVENSTIEFVIKNPEGDETAMNTMANELVRTCDIVLGNATPAAVALQIAASNNGKKDLPILFTSVTDAVEAGLVASNEKPGGNITGTSDASAVEDQVKLVKEVLPEAKKLGIIYNVSEVNSRVQAEAAKKQAEDLGMEVEVKTVSEAGEITSTVSQLGIDGCEALFIPTDNLIANNMAAVAQGALQHKILVVAGEGSMVMNGGHITIAVDYKKLGEQTAELAVKILKGEKPADLAVVTQSLDELSFVANLENLEAIDVELPQSIKDKLS